MNCGLGNLDSLKRDLLLPGEGDAEDAARDAGLVSVGLGVAAIFESFCDRRFARLVGDTLEFSAARETITLRRYPIEAITLVELRATITEGWIEVAGTPENYLPSAGLVFFDGPLGFLREVGRITWTGGYFVETREPADEGYGDVPEGAEPLPADLALAWRQQCKFFWERMSIESRAKAGITTEGGNATGFLQTGDELLAVVTATLNQYRRLA